MQILVIILGLAGGVSDKTFDPASMAINHIIKGVYDETRVKTVETFKEKYAPDFMD